MQAQIRCFTLTCAVVAESPRRKDGSTSVARVSQVSLPASTSLPSMSVVMALVLEATMKSVVPSTLPGTPSSRTPKPPAKTTLPFSIRPTPTPGTRAAFMASSTKAPSAAMRLSSSGRAFRPANVSRSYPLGRSWPKMRATWASRFSPTSCAMS